MKAMCMTLLLRKKLQTTGDKLYRFIELFVRVLFSHARVLTCTLRSFIKLCLDLNKSIRFSQVQQTSCASVVLKPWTKYEDSLRFFDFI